MRVQLPDGPLLDTLSVRHALKGYADVGGKIARLLADGELLPLRRGLYARRPDLDPLGLAGPIYGPSYLSFETALSWHGMIPEGVAEILSASTRRAAVFDTGYGRYRYLTIPKRIYPVGIQRVAESDLPYLIASPTKALADRIAREPGFRSMAEVSRWIDGMRIDPLPQLDRQELRDCAEGYGRPSVRWLWRWAEKSGILSS